MSRNTNFDNQFGAFLAAWLRHDDLRKGASVPELFASRRNLDDLRYQMRMAGQQIR